MHDCRQLAIVEHTSSSMFMFITNMQSHNGLCTTTKKKFRWKQESNKVWKDNRQNTDEGNPVTPEEAINWTTD